MQKTQHPSNNHVLGAPKGTDISVCSALPVTMFTYQDGTPAISSWWRPTEQEMLDIACGKPVKLTILGTSQPPVLIEVEN